MKVLVIDEWLPWPLESGKKIRSYNLISRLARKFDIFYIAYVRLPEEKDKIRKFESLGIHVIPVDDIRTTKWTSKFYFEVLLNFFSAGPFSTAYHIKETFIKKLIESIDDIRPDLIHCEWTNLAPFLKHVKDVPTVIAAHNVESDIWDRWANNSSNPFIKILGKHQKKKIEALEKEWYPKADHCIAVSQEDLKVIESYGAGVSLVENGVDVQYYDKFNSEGIDENRMVFVASFDTFSNQDAVDFFMIKIFPGIKKSNPAANIWFVGKEPTQKTRSYASKDSHVHVTGTVPDVRDYIAKASVCVVPLRIGGGSRLKILEAMAMKKPVISTTVGAEGLEVIPSENIIISDDPGDFSKKTFELLKNQRLQNELGAAGWKLVKSKYDWQPLADKQSLVWKTCTLRI